MAKKKSALPKKIAGIKVPKPLRKSSMLRAMLNNPMGRDLLADALVAGAGAAAAVLIEKREDVADAGKQAAKAGKKGARKGYRAAALAGRALESAVSAMVGTVSDAAQSFASDGKKRKRNGGGVTAH